MCVCVCGLFCVWFQSVESWLGGFRSEARQYDGNKNVQDIGSAHDTQKTERGNKG